MERKQQGRTAVPKECGRQIESEKPKKKKIGKVNDRRKKKREKKL